MCDLFGDYLSRNLFGEPVYYAQKPKEETEAEKMLLASGQLELKLNPEHQLSLFE